MRNVLCLALLLAVCCQAGEPVAAVVDARLQRFEQAVDAAFRPVRTQLDGWRAKRAQAALREVSALLPKAGPRDRIHLAYQILATDPKHRAAREVYTALGLNPPFAEDGTPVVGTHAPACDDPATVAKAMDLAYPPFDEVTRAVDLRGSVAAPFWKKLESELASLRKDLTRIATDRAADQAAGVVYPMLAHFQPRAPEVQAYYAAIGRAVPAGRTWFNPVDRWLLDRELAGIDALRPPSAKQPANWYGSGGGELPALVPGAAVEVIAQWRRGARIELAGAPGSPAVVWAWGDGGLAIMPGGDRTKAVMAATDVDLSVVAVPVRCVVRGRQAAVFIGGIPVAQAVLPQAVALRRWSANGLDQPRLLRVRYLASAPEPTVPVAAARPAPTETPPAWQAERRKTLASDVTCAFEDVRMDEVAAALTRIVGSPIRLAGSAEPLADLPVTMTAAGVPLSTVLEWLQRLAGVEAVPDEQGISLEWKR